MFYFMEHNLNKNEYLWQENPFPFIQQTQYDIAALLMIMVYFIQILYCGENKIKPLHKHTKST